jgi:hypothetical protein
MLRKHWIPAFAGMTEKTKSIISQLLTEMGVEWRITE